jgi:hypothetical protein
MDMAFICSDCEKFILAGETMWSVNVHHEVWEDVSITVLDARSAFVFCEECASRRDFSNVLIPIKKIGSLKPRI